jgi:hypothetical protein
MKKGMEESYIEDLANRDGPVHALATREGAAKRWMRGARRPAMQPRNRQHRGADVLWFSGRQHRWRRFSRAVSGPRGVEEPVHARDLFMHENREISRSPACRDGGAGRAGKATAVIP